MRPWHLGLDTARCLKIREKVSFYILCGQKFTKNAKNFEKTEAYGQTVFPDRSLLVGQKLKDSNTTLRVIFKHCDIFFANNYLMHF